MEDEYVSFGARPVFHVEKYIQINKVFMKERRQLFFFFTILTVNFKPHDIFYSRFQVVTLVNIMSIEYEFVNILNSAIWSREAFCLTA